MIFDVISRGAEIPAQGETLTEVEQEKKISSIDKREVFHCKTILILVYEINSQRKTPKPCNSTNISL